MVPFPEPDIPTDGSRTEVGCTWITVLSIIQGTGVLGLALAALLGLWFRETLTFAMKDSRPGCIPNPTKGMTCWVFISVPQLPPAITSSQQESGSQASVPKTRPCLLLLSGWVEVKEAEDS